MNLLEEVDGIVRSMEDEKANKDVSEKTRDALARIEGLDRDPVSIVCSSHESCSLQDRHFQTLSLPRLSRTLIEEHIAPDHDQQSPAENTNRRSLRRLSDLMRGHGHSAEVWEV